MYKKILIIFISLLISFPCVAKEYSYRYTPFESGNVPDDIPIFDEENKRHFMEEYEGQTILLVFWASWCSQCTNEMPSLDILKKDFRKLDFKILPLSVDYSGIEAAKEFHKKYDLRHLPIMHDYKNSLFRALEITALPTSIIIDKEGKLVGKFIGDVPWHDMAVRQILLDNIPNNPATPKNSHKDISLDQKVNVNNRHPEGSKDTPQDPKTANEVPKQSSQKQSQNTNNRSKPLPQDNGNLQSQTTNGQLHFPQNDVLSTTKE